MSETFDNSTGRPIGVGVIAVGSTLVMAARELAQHKEMLGKIGSGAFELVKANPKVALGIAAVGGVGYCVYRLTRPGTVISCGSFKYERTSKP